MATQTLVKIIALVVFLALFSPYFAKWIVYMLNLPALKVVDDIKEGCDAALSLSKGKFAEDIIVKNDSNCYIKYPVFVPVRRVRREIILFIPTYLLSDSELAILADILGRDVEDIRESCALFLSVICKEDCALLSDMNKKVIPLEEKEIVLNDLYIDYTVGNIRFLDYALYSPPESSAGSVCLFLLLNETPILGFTWIDPKEGVKNIEIGGYWRQFYRYITDKRVCAILSQYPGGWIKYNVNRDSCKLESPIASLRVHLFYIRPVWGTDTK